MDLLVFKVPSGGSPPSLLEGEDDRVVCRCLKSVVIPTFKKKTELLKSASSRVLKTKKHVSKKKTHPKMLIFTILGKLTSPLSEKQKVLETEFLDFNVHADQLKENADWKEQLNDYINKAQGPTQQKIAAKAIAKKTAYELRSFDREILQEIFDIYIDSPNIKKETKEKLKKLKEEHPVQVITTDQKDKIGGGAVNEVFLIKFKDKNRKKKTFIFKPDIAEKKGSAEGMWGTSILAGIPKGAAAHFPSRAVFSSELEDVIWPDKERISVTAEHAIVDGQRGIIMSCAQGKPPSWELAKIDIKVEKENQKIIEENFLKKGVLSPEGAKVLCSQYNLTKITDMNIDKDGNMHLVGRKKVFKNFDPDSAKIFESLLYLQLKDWLAAEVDRHPENYLVDKNNVTGIDQDCCGGVKAIPKNRDVRKQSKGKFIVPNKGSLLPRLPPAVTKTMADYIKNLMDDPTRFIELMGRTLNPKERTAGIKRLKIIHKHIFDPEKCRIISSDPDENKTEGEKLFEEIGIFDSNSCYFLRDRDVYNAPYVKTNPAGKWNHLRAHREN